MQAENLEKRLRAYQWTSNLTDFEQQRDESGGGKKKKIFCLWGLQSHRWLRHSDCAQWAH